MGRLASVYNMTILQPVGGKLSNTQWTEMFCASQDSMRFEALQDAHSS